MENSFFDFKIFAAPEAPSKQAYCQGDGELKVLAVYQAAEANGELIDFLSRIFKAVQLNLPKDICLYLITPGMPISLSAIHRDFPFEKVILFGPSPKQVGIQFEPLRYQLTEHAGIQYLFADDLQEIYEERQQGGKKRAGALWAALRDMFPKTAQ